MAVRLSARRFFGTLARDVAGEGFAVALRRATVPPHDVPEHSHAEPHFVLALDRGYLSSADGAAAGTASGLLVYNPAHVVHRDRFAEAGGRFLSVTVDPEWIADDAPRAAVALGDAPARIARRLVGSCVAGGDDAVAESLVLLLVAALARARTEPAPDWLGRGAEALADRAGEAGLTIASVAREIGVHPVHFARAHVRHFGTTPGEALRGHRLGRALGALAAGRSLSETAHGCGFADQSHMTRCFRAAIGTTPARYRAAFG